MAVQLHTQVGNGIFFSIWYFALSADLVPAFYFRYLCTYMVGREWGWLSSRAEKFLQANYIQAFSMFTSKNRILSWKKKSCFLSTNMYLTQLPDFFRIFPILAKGYVGKRICVCSMYLQQKGPKKSHRWQQSFWR